MLATHCSFRIAHVWEEQAIFWEQQPLLFAQKWKRNRICFIKTNFTKGVGVFHEKFTACVYSIDSFLKPTFKTKKCIFQFA